MATPHSGYRSNPTVNVNIDGELINLAGIFDAGLVGGALVLVLIDPASPDFDEVQHTRVLNPSPTTSAVFARYQSLTR